VIACFLCALGFAVAPVGIAPGATLAGETRFEARVDGVEAARVELVIDGWLRDTEREAPFEFEWDTSRELDGPHRVELWAVARDGRVSTTTLDVQVSNRFALRFAQARTRVRGTVRVAASATGSPQWVEVHVDGNLRATEQEPPYAIEWDTTEERDGEHTLTLWAVAPNGRVATTSRHVVVHNGRAQATAAATAATVARLKRETWQWQSLTRTPRTSQQGDLAFWRAQAEAARKRASRPPHWRQFLCIHRYEGAWNASTGNGYYGGLQMNMDFQRAYGPELLARKGTANNWTPLEQIWVAERAVPGRGFNPWPQTARMCGLL
jgi:Transglycosylase-like domain/Bacterial Ig domain